MAYGLLGVSAAAPLRWRAGNRQPMTAVAASRRGVSRKRTGRSAHPEHAPAEGRHRWGGQFHTGRASGSPLRWPAGNWWSEPRPPIPAVAASRRRLSRKRTKRSAHPEHGLARRGNPCCKPIGRSDAVKAAEQKRGLAGVALWVRGPSGPLPPKAARNSRRPKAGSAFHAASSMQVCAARTGRAARRRPYCGAKARRKWASSSS